MSSRLKKALDLISELIINHEYGDYISVRDLEIKLGTDQRNIRKIVSQINETTSFKIDSKKGPYGGYRINENIILRIFDISFKKFIKLLEFASHLKSKFPNNESVREHYNLINEIGRTDSINLTKKKGYSYYDNPFTTDFDYLEYMHQLKSEVLTHDIWLTDFPEEKRYVSITYYEPNQKPIKFRSIVLKAYYIGGYEYFAMYDIDNYKVRLLNLNYITFIKLFEDEDNLYTEEEFINYNEDKKNVEQAEKYLKEIKTKNFVKININSNIHKETKDLIFNCVGFHMTRQQFDILKQVYIKKTKLPILFLRDHFEYNEIKVSDKLKLNMLDCDDDKPLIHYENAIKLDVEEIDTYYNEGEN